MRGCLWAPRCRPPPAPWSRFSCSSLSRFWCLPAAKLDRMCLYSRMTGNNTCPIRPLSSICSYLPPHRNRNHRILLLLLNFLFHLVPHRPFSRRLPEFQFWLSSQKAVLLSFGMTLFSIFNVPVFWPILLIYFFILMVRFLVCERPR